MLQGNCQYGCSGGACLYGPDLLISNMSFAEYDTNGTVYVSVAATIKNVGDTIANFFISTLSGMFTDYKAATLEPQATTTISSYYLCWANHTATAYADIFDNVTESNEGNNAASAYIDCVI